MLVSVVRGRIQERTRNFGHLVHETCPRNCVWSVYKFYKKQTKSENHETCWDVVISYVEAMIKFSEDFMHVVTYDAYKPGHLYIWSHVEMLGFLSIIRDDVLEIFLNFYHGTRMRYLDLSTSFMNFRLRFHLIEFKNYLLASSWSCLDVKMCEIFCLFLDTASTNTY